MGRAHALSVPQSVPKLWWAESATEANIVSKTYYLKMVEPGMLIADAQANPLPLLFCVPYIRDHVN